MIQLAKKKRLIIEFYLYTFHNIEFGASHTGIGAVEEWAWHREVDLGKGRDDPILPIDAVCPGEQAAGGTATQDVLLTRSRTKVVGRVGLTISEDVMYAKLSECLLLVERE
jgi:hypothetical protein